MTGSFDFGNINEAMGITDKVDEQPELEVQKWFCLRCFSSSEVVVNLDDRDMEYMCPHCQARMKKVD